MLDLEQFKNILVWDQFYWRTLDITRPLLETHNDNMYIIVVIDHYSKRVKVHVVEHDVKIVVKFLEDKLFASFEYLGYILINNGGEWAVEFDLLCNNYEITHQYTAPQWPKCNNMVKRLVKTLKHGLIMIFATIEHA